MRLKNKTAIITGAAQGIGREILDVFVKEGCKVTATDIDNKMLTELKKFYGDCVLTVQSDISKEEDWGKVVANTINTFGKVDILVNNAAIMVNKNLMDTTVDDFMKVMKVNALGTFLGMKHVGEEMKKVGKGSIVNINSIGSLSSGIADGGDAAYSASKGAVRSLAKHAAFQLCKNNIRVNSVHPGGVMTLMLEEVLKENPKLEAASVDNLPLPPHHTTTADVAYAALYLACDESISVTGTEMVVDCGFMMK